MACLPVQSCAPIPTRDTVTMRSKGLLALCSAAALLLSFNPSMAGAASRDTGRDKVVKAVVADQADAIQRLRDWIALPTIANMGINTPAGAATLKRAGIEYSLFPRRAGSWPGVVFTGPPLNMAAGHFGVGRGGGAHAPDEWLLVESSDPKVAGYVQQAQMFVDYLYETARLAARRR